MVASSSFMALPNVQIPLVAKAADNDSPARIAKIAETAKDFEATFLSLLLKEMRSTLEPEGLFAGDTGDVQGGMFDLYMGQHLANAGGVGFAATLIQQLRGTSYAPTAHTGTPLGRGVVA